MPGWLAWPQTAGRRCGWLRVHIVRLGTRLPGSGRHRIEPGWPGRHPREGRTAKIGAFKMGAAQVGTVQAGVTQPGLVQVGPAQVGSWELGAGQAGEVEIGGDQVLPAGCELAGWLSDQVTGGHGLYQRLLLDHDGRSLSL